MANRVLLALLPAVSASFSLSSHTHSPSVAVASREFPRSDDTSLIASPSCTSSMDSFHSWIWGPGPADVPSSFTTSTTPTNPSLGGIWGIGPVIPSVSSSSTPSESQYAPVEVRNAAAMGPGSLVVTLASTTATSIPVPTSTELCGFPFQIVDMPFPYNYAFNHTKTPVELTYEQLAKYQMNRAEFTKCFKEHIEACYFQIPGSPSIDTMNSYLRPITPLTWDKTSGSYNLTRRDGEINAANMTLVERYHGNDTMTPSGLTYAKLAYSQSNSSTLHECMQYQDQSCHSMQLHHLAECGKARMACVFPIEYGPTPEILMKWVLEKVPSTGKDVEGRLVVYIDDDFGKHNDFSGGAKTVDASSDSPVHDNLTDVYDKNFTLTPVGLTYHDLAWAQHSQRDFWQCFREHHSRCYYQIPGGPSYDQLEAYMDDSMCIRECSRYSFVNRTTGCIDLFYPNGLQQGPAGGP